MRKSSFLILSVVLTAAGFYGQSAIAAPVIYQKTRTLQTQAGGTVKLQLTGQDVAITTHPRHTVNVTVTIKSSAGSMDEKRKLIKKLTPAIEARGKNIIIQSRHHGGNDWSFNFFGLSFNSVSTKVALVMPADMNVHFKLGSGDFSFNANRADTKIHGRSGSGDVRIHSASKDVALDTGSGDQSIKLTQSGKNVKLSAGSGDVVFNGGSAHLDIDTGSGNIKAAGHSAQARLQAGSGDIDISDLTGDLQVGTGSGDITARWLKLAAHAHISAEAGSGDVRLILPASANLRGTLSANSGDIDSEFPGTSHDHSKRFELSGGQSAVPVDVQTGSGDIHLQKRD